jgi:hypothetical protein
VICRLEVELAHHAGKDNGHLPVTYDDFVDYGIHRHSVAPALREAVALGFIEITRRGRAGNADFRRPTLFRITFRPSEGVYGDGSHEWRRFATMEEATAAAASARAAKRVNSKIQCRKKTLISDGF